MFRASSRRILLFFALLLVLVALLVTSSYFAARRAAAIRVKQDRVPVFAYSNSRLVLFAGGQFEPHWMVVYDLRDPNADFPFHVYVSLLGGVRSTSAPKM